MLFFRSRPLLTGTVAFEKPRKPRATPGCRCVALRGSPPKPSPSLTAPFSSGTAGPFRAGDRSFLSPPPLLYHRKTKKSHRFSKRRAMRPGGLLGLILCPVCAPCCPLRRKKPLYAQKSHFSFFNFFCGGFARGRGRRPPRIRMRMWMRMRMRMWIPPPLNPLPPCRTHASDSEICPAGK